MDKIITAQTMIDYLQWMMDNWQAELDMFGKDDRVVKSDMHAMISCKNMVEGLIGMPVNLQRNGKVTVGF